MRQRSKKYIQDQDRHDIMRDKLTSREYQDPFKGVAKAARALGLNSVKASVFRRSR